jgi:outer membrane protein assembly factor BamB
MKGQFEMAKGMGPASIGWWVAMVLWTLFGLCEVLPAVPPKPQPSDDWPQWRGKNRDGRWDESGVVRSLTADNLKVLWRQPLGTGYSGPTVAGGRVLVMDRQESPEQSESVVCFDARNGQRLWQYRYPAVYTISYKAGPRASVTIEGNRAYALGAMGHLHCLDVEDGRLLWQRDLNADYQISATRRLPIWGIAPSPLIYQNLVVLQIAGAEGASVVGLDKFTGREIWRALEDVGQYSAPILTRQNGKDLLVCWTGESIAGLDPASGQVHWRHPFPVVNMPIGVATPIVKDQHIFVTSFYDGSMMIRMLADRMGVEEVWRARGPNERTTQALHSIISTPIWIDDHIYGVDSYGELRCLRANDGQRVWENQLAVKKNRWATIHFVPNGEDVWMFNEQGEMLIGRLSPEKFEEVSRVKIIEPTLLQLPDQRRGGVCWTHPAFANRCVFVRNDEEIVCIDVAESRKSSEPK